MLARPTSTHPWRAPVTVDVDEEYIAAAYQVNDHMEIEGVDSYTCYYCLHYNYVCQETHTLLTQCMYIRNSLPEFDLAVLLCKFIHGSYISGKDQ